MEVTWFTSSQYIYYINIINSPVVKCEAIKSLSEGFELSV